MLVSPVTISDVFDERFSLAMAEPTLENICSDVQINISMYLHPSDILSLRKVCPHPRLSLLKSVYHQDL